MNTKLIAFISNVNLICGIYILKFTFNKYEKLNDNYIFFVNNTLILNSLLICLNLFICIDYTMISASRYSVFLGISTWHLRRIYMMLMFSQS